MAEICDYDKLSREELIRLVIAQKCKINELACSDANRINTLSQLMGTILNKIPVAIFVKNVADDFKHIYFNPAAEAFAGKNLSCILGQTDFELFSDPVRAAEIREEDMIALRTGENVKYATQYVTPGGITKYVNSIRLLLNTHHTPLIISLFWDAADSDNADENVKQANEALQSSFLSNMSHEIRTPLNAIIGFSSLLAETDNEEDRRCYIDIINRNNDMLLRLMNDIFDYTQMEAGIANLHLEPVNLKTCCEHVFMYHVGKIPRGIIMNFDAKHLPDLQVNVDMARLQQALSNLLTNAAKFTKQGSVTLKYEIVGKEVKISVVDTGIGILPEYKRVIFERFVKVDDFGQGTGLGLTISKKIIEMMGGRIGVESELGKGSEFWICLPLLSSSEEPDVLSSSSVKRSCILVAEDVEENYYLLSIILGKQYDLHRAHNGKEAVELFNQCNPNIILMDIKMPEMDGFEASRKIRQLSSTVPIFALTAFSQEDEMKTAKECGINEYLVKPLDIQLLKDTVEKYLTFL